VFGLGPATRIYLAAGVTDMRKGFEGLYGLVRDCRVSLLVGTCSCSATPSAIG